MKSCMEYVFPSQLYTSAVSSSFVPFVAMVLATEHVTWCYDYKGSAHSLSKVTEHFFQFVHGVMVKDHHSNM